MRKKTRLIAAICAAALVITGVGPVPMTGKAASSGSQDMYRLYNASSGEHFYTASAGERDTLIQSGWLYEDIGWVAPQSSDTPVYRLYNGSKTAGDHHYTMDKAERDMLVANGWQDEGIGWYSDDAKKTPLYREYNPNAKTGTHNYTTGQGEHAALVAAGWRDENIGWYALEGGKEDAAAENYLIVNAAITSYAGTKYQMSSSKSYQYDKYGMPVKAIDSYSGAKDIVNTYSGSGSISKAGDKTYTYDSKGRVQKISYSYFVDPEMGWSKVTYTFSYNNNGSISSIQEEESVYGKGTYKFSYESGKDNLTLKSISHSYSGSGTVSFTTTFTYSQKGDVPVDIHSKRYDGAKGEAHLTYAKGFHPQDSNMNAVYASQMLLLAQLAGDACDGFAN